MRKNRMMRLASVLLVCVLLTTSVISGTFAKYTTSVTSSDKARVANWGFERTNSMDLTDLFLSSYDNVNSENGEDVIAPGTWGDTVFNFAYDETNGAEGPEVAYTFTVKVEDECAEEIKDNVNILWSLDGVEYKTDDAGKSWDKMVAAIKAMSGEEDGSCEYEPNTLPDAFSTDDSNHTIAWRWIFSNSQGNDTYDTNMGNNDVLAKCSIKITITAEQID